MAENPYLLQRLTGIQQMLIGVHGSGAAMSSATKGHERDAFVGGFLSQVLPPTFRFGTGDATDLDGQRSGQLDVVVEYPFAPSLPVPHGVARLYLAEGVAAVVEVKSDVANQWSEAVATAEELAKLTPQRHEIFTIAGGPPKKIPLFVAGYTGWQKIETVQQHLENAPEIAGVLVIDPGIFVGRADLRGMSAMGPWALWAMICSLHHAVTSLSMATTDPFLYSNPLQLPAPQQKTTDASS